MSCRSNEKIICPYCGAEMEIKTAKYGQGALGWAMCRNENCSAEGPLVSGKTMERAVENARTAALRCYTPIFKPLKPMTLEEVKGASRAWMEVETEGWDMQFVKMDKRSGGVVYQTPGSEQLYGVLYDDYGKTWRCWDREPTDEERSAAEWET